MLAFVRGCWWCSLHCSRLAYLCNGSSISATAGSTSGTDLGTAKGGSAVKCGFQGHPGNIVPIAAVNKKKSQGCQSGMYGGWGLDVFLVARNCCTVKTVCTGALLWWMNQFWFCHGSRCFQQTYSIRHCKISWQ